MESCGTRAFDPTAFISVHTFDSRSAFDVAFAAGRRLVESIETNIRAQHAVAGFCHFCGAVTSMTVDAGANFGKAFPNLREGLVCPCGAKNRDRLMLLASGRALMSSGGTAFFGALGRWADWARQNCECVTFCEYLGPSLGSGTVSQVQGVTVRNEDLTNLTLPDSSMDLVLHGDVLEHIPDVRSVFSETLRILRPGGRTIFTAPFFHERDETVVRAIVENGEIKHLLPPEMHGDPLSESGILAYYNFGWSLLKLISEAGFTSVVVKLIYAPHLGIVSNGCPVSVGNMLPIYVEAIKP